MPEEVYAHFAAIIENIEEANMKARNNSEISIRLIEILDDTVQKLSEIGE